MGRENIFVAFFRNSDRVLLVEKQPNFLRMVSLDSSSNYVSSYLDRFPPSRFCPVIVATVRILPG